MKELVQVVEAVQLLETFRTRTGHRPRKATVKLPAPPEWFPTSGRQLYPVGKDDVARHDLYGVVPHFEAVRQRLAPRPAFLLRRGRTVEQVYNREVFV